LKRQINSLLFERLALSKDKKGLMRLAKKGQKIQKPADLVKDICLQIQTLLAKQERTYGRIEKKTCPA
jgi:predicted nuclease of restriction endonuclease-like (RecB) superfamily